METPEFAEVAIPSIRAGTLTYAIPAPLLGQVRCGQLVQVPLHQGQRSALVVATHNRSEVSAPRPLEAILQSEPLIGEREIDLAYWLSERYLAPLGRCLWLFLPRGSLAGRDWWVCLLDEGARGETLFEHQLLNWLRQRGPLWGRQLSGRMPGMPWRKALKDLAARGLVRAEMRLRPPPQRRSAEILQWVAAPALLAAVAAAGTRGLSLMAIPGNGAKALALAGLIRRERIGGAGGEGGCYRLSLAIPAVTNELGLRQGKRKRQRNAEQRAILEQLRAAGGALSRAELRARGATPANLRNLLASGHLLARPAKPTLPVPRVDEATLAHYPRKPPPLTPDQEKAWQPLTKALAAGRYAAFLLHGVTGSGKTELYLRAIQQALDEGRSAILLVPEIALTAQTLARVAARFPGEVAALHSAVPERERQEILRLARAGQLRIIVGARSALFTPLRRLGLVILDEEHDASYQQTPPFPPPHYHARALAEEMMRRAGGLLLLGSATPALETHQRARQGELRHLRLPQRVYTHRRQLDYLAGRSGRAHRYRPLAPPNEDALKLSLPQVKIIDMRAEMAAGNRSIFSAALLRALGGVLARGEQAILYLNRRGLRTHIFCRDCGGVLSCNRCDTPLTQHEDGRLRCHHCGARRALPARCPRCASHHIRFYGAGTQQVQRVFSEHFPKARSLRWDADSARRPEDHARILRRYLEGDVPVLIGTQMIAKGLDLPLVTLVGVVNADRGLALPDFRAAERVFQLLTQVAGRAGRSLLGGQVLLQTYQPEHHVIQMAARHDYDGFAEKELTLRRELENPPFGQLARVVCRHKQEARARGEAEKAARWIRARMRRLRLRTLEVIGPLPCYYHRLQDYYRWQVLLRGGEATNEVALIFRAQPPRRGWMVEMEPISTL